MGSRMKYHPESTTLEFSCHEEVTEFHVQVTDLVRRAMVEATRAVEDPEQAKVLSRDVMKEYRAVLRALNSLRSGLERKQF